MKFGSIIAALTLCVASSVGEVEAKTLSRDLGKKNKLKCDFTGMYDIIETATFATYDIPAMDTAKMGLVCFSDEDDVDNYGELFNLGGGRRLETAKKTIDESRRLYYGSDPPVQFCWFEAIGFPYLDRRLEETAADNNRELYPGYHNYGFALVFEEKVPFGDKEKDICIFYTTDDGELPTMGMEIKDGVLAIQTIAGADFPYFAHKTTG